MIEKSEKFCSEMLGDRYFRMNPLLPSEISMDDPKQIPLLLEVARTVDLTHLCRFIRTKIYRDQ